MKIICNTIAEGYHLHLGCRYDQVFDYVQGTDTIWKLRTYHFVLLLFILVDSPILADPAAAFENGIDEPQQNQQRRSNMAASELIILVQCSRDYFSFRMSGGDVVLAIFFCKNKIRMHAQA